MPYPCRLHQRAAEEYIEAYEWYELRKEGLGTRFMECAEKRLIQISEHPERYSKKQGNFRQIKIEEFPYIIVYEFFRHRQLVHIAAIYHAKRNPKRKYRKMK